MSMQKLEQAKMNKKEKTQLNEQMKDTFKYLFN